MPQIVTNEFMGQISIDTFFIPSCRPHHLPYRCCTVFLAILFGKSRFSIEFRADHATIHASGGPEENRRILFRNK